MKMDGVIWSAKQRLWKIIAFLFFYSGTLRLLQYFVDRYQYEKKAPVGAVFPYIKRRASRTVQILAYHRVNDEHDPFFPATPTRVFARQMECLATHFSVCALDEVVKRMGKGEVPEKAVVITFDDGYRDNYLNAFPVLQQLSLPATIFLATSAIGSGKVLWHDRVFSAFRETRVSYLEDYITIEDRLPLRTLRDKLATHQIVLQFLWSKSDSEREFWIEKLVERLAVADRTEEFGLMLSWEEVVRMHQAGISFGSHTVNHPILSMISEVRMKQEIADSKRVIESKLRTPITTFAYPVGRRQDFNEMTKVLLKEAEYNCALTTVFGANEVGQDAFELRRMLPWVQDPHVFGLQLSYYKFLS